MSVDLLKNIVGQCPENTALLGLDVGKKTIGLALSDPGQKFAMPLHTIKRTKFTEDVCLLKTISQDYEVGGYVIGLPVHMNEEEGRRAQSVRDFALEFYKILDGDPWVALWDERLSTVSAEKHVDEFVDKKSVRTNAKKSGLIDKLAAQIILQGAMDFMTLRRNA